MQSATHSRRASALLGIFVLAAYTLHCANFVEHINDDAFITFRYSRFLALGRGPYFNVGEHVEGYTNLLLMLSLAGYVTVAGPDSVLLAAKFIGWISGIGALLCTWALCTAWLRKIPTLRAVAPLFAWAAPAAVAAECGFALNSTSGLETSLFAFWIALGLWLVQRARDAKRWRGAGLAFALAALTRPEGAWCFAAVFLARLIIADWADAPRRRALLADALVVAGAVLGHLLFRFAAYDGELLPNTYYAKQGGFLGAGGAPEYCWNYLRLHWLGLLPGLALAPLLAVKRSARRAIVPALLVVAAGISAIFTAGPDWMPGFRLLVPYAPAAAALSVVGLCVLADRFLARPRWPAAAVCAALPLALLLWQTALREHYHAHLLTRARGYLNGHVATADWISTRAAPGDTIALMDIGIIGYRCIDQRILDITGLTDRSIAKSPGSFLGKEIDPRYVLDREPRFIVAVLYAPDEGPEIDLRKLRHWTSIEESLLSAPDFARRYLRLREPPAGARLAERLAAQLGAEAVFRHDHPGIHYLLAVYERHNAADEAGGSRVPGAAPLDLAQPLADRPRHLGGALAIGKR
ncbi:MAG: hypothetical protein HRF50_01120 [Phycisphaerae bacterium]|jgi:hypothetical protein